MAKKFLNLFEEDAVAEISAASAKRDLWRRRTITTRWFIQTLKRVVSVIDFGDMHEGFTVGGAGDCRGLRDFREGRSAGRGRLCACRISRNYFCRWRKRKSPPFFFCAYMGRAACRQRGEFRATASRWWPDDPYVYRRPKHPAWGGARTGWQRLIHIRQKEYFRAAAGKVGSDRRQEILGWLQCRHEKRPFG